MKLAPLVAALLLSSAQLRAEDSADTTLQQLARFSKEGIDVYISGDYARWKQLGEKDFVEIAESSAALLDDYIEPGFVPVRLERPHGID